VKIIEAHNAGNFTGRYSDWVHAGGVIAEDEMNRRAAAEGPVGTFDGASKRHRARDSAPTHIHVHLPLTTDQETLGSGPELKGAKEGVIGASEAWTSTPPIAELDGRAADYKVIDREDGRGCALYRRASKDSKKRVGDADRFASMVQAHDAAQQTTLHGIAEAQKAFWAQPENSGRW
jgi:hypothetical protein